MNTIPLALSLHGYIAAVVLALLAWVLFRRSLRDSTTPVALLICSIAASFAFDLQHTGWWYHKYPHIAILLVAIAYLLVDVLAPALRKVVSTPRHLRTMLLIACGIMLIPLCVVGRNPGILRTLGTHSIHFEVDDYFSQYRPPTTVYALSTDVSPLSFAYNRGLNWGGRFAHLWMLPAIVQNELGPTGPHAPFKRLSPEALSKLAELQRTESAEDLDYWQPSVVLVERCERSRPCIGTSGKDFNMLSWFLQSPRFSQAWSHYRHDSELTTFEVYKRVP